MKKTLTLVMCCLALMAAGMAQPKMGKISERFIPERFNKERFLERNLKKEKQNLPQEKQFLNAKQFSSLKKEAFLQEVQSQFSQQLFNKLIQKEPSLFSGQMVNSQYFQNQDNKYYPSKPNTHTKKVDWWEPDTITTYYAYDDTDCLYYQSIMTYYENGNQSSIVLKWHNGTEWENQCRNLYISYDTQNNRTEEITQHWESGQWADKSKVITTYNANNDRLEQTYQEKEGEEWIIKDYAIWNYDEQYNITYFFSKSWDWETNQLQNNRQEFFQLDEHKNYIESLSQNWESEGWVNNSMWTAVYDERDRLLEEIDMFWVSEKWENTTKCSWTWNELDWCTSNSMEYWIDGKWVKNNGYWFKYDEYNNGIEIVSKVGDEETNEWVNFWIEGFGYDAKNRLITDTLQYWNLELKLWVNEENVFFEYDLRDNMTKGIIQNWDLVSEKWVNVYKEEAEYNLQNKATFWLSQYWDLVSEKWVNYLKNNYTLNLQNNCTEALGESWDLELKKWINSWKDTYEYDEGQNTTFCLFQSWENETWVGHNERFTDVYYNNRESYFQEINCYKIEVSYVNTGTLSVSENKQGNKNSVSIFPNPVSNILNIETGNNDIIPEVKIYSIQGVLLINTKGNRIDVSSLANGFYFADVNGQTFKIVKQ